jgi:hypothetical protein
LGRRRGPGIAGQTLAARDAFLICCRFAGTPHRFRFRAATRKNRFELFVLGVEFGGRPGRTRFSAGVRRDHSVALHGRFEGDSSQGRPRWQGCFLNQCNCFFRNFVNGTLSVLRRVLDIAIEAGVRYDNPAKAKEVRRARVLRIQRAGSDWSLTSQALPNDCRGL